MSGSILASSASFDYAIKSVLYQNGWHISTLSPYCFRKLLDIDLLSRSEYFSILISDVFLREKS